MMISLLNAILEFTLRALLQSESGRCFSSITLVAIICLPTLQAVEPQRHAWNESKVIGFPDPPAPFEVVPLHPHLDIAKPMGVTALPGTKDLLVHAHKALESTVKGEELFIPYHVVVLLVFPVKVVYLADAPDHDHHICHL